MRVVNNNKKKAAGRGGSICFRRFSCFPPFHFVFFLLSSNKNFFPPKFGDHSRFLYVGDNILAAAVRHRRSRCGCSRYSLISPDDSFGSPDIQQHPTLSYHEGWLVSEESHNWLFTAETGPLPVYPQSRSPSGRLLTSIDSARGLNSPGLGLDWSARGSPRQPTIRGPTGFFGAGLV